MLSKVLSKVFSSTTVQKHQFFGLQPSLRPNSHIHTWILKVIAFTKWTFVSKVMSLLFNMLYRLVLTFLPRSKRLLISWLQSPSAVIWEPKKIVCPCFHCFLIYLPWSDGTRCHYLSFWMLSFKPAFSLSFTFISGSLVPLCFLPLGWCHLHIWNYWYFSQKSWFQLVLHPACHLHDVLCI